MTSVRACTLADVPELVGLMRQQVKLQQEFDSSWRTDPNLDWNAYVVARIERSNVRIFVAEKNGRLVGYVDGQTVGQDRAPTGGVLRRALSAVVRGVRGYRVPPSQSLFKPRRRFGLINDVYVAKAYRHHADGIGFELCQTVFEWLRDRHVDDIEAWISTGNSAARGFFDRLGFEETRVLVRRTGRPSKSNG